jgi:prepilin-type N-terminal cleavage/methylation domain-containing protein
MVNVPAGHGAHGQILTSASEENEMRKNQKGFSLIELLIVVAIILIIAAIAIPNLLRARIAANEASAVASCRTMNTASITFNSSYGAYPATPSGLGPSGAGVTPTSTSADLLDHVLTPSGGVNVSTKSGYTFTYASTTPFNTYTVNADPVVSNQTGVRHFFTDQSGVVRWNGTPTAALTDSPI